MNRKNLTVGEKGVLTLMAKQVLEAKTLKEAKENVQSWVTANGLDVDSIQKVDTYTELKKMVGLCGFCERGRLVQRNGTNLCWRHMFISQQRLV